MTESALRERVVELGRSIFRRGLTFGSSGNISMRVGRLLLVPYFPPGDEALAEAVGRKAATHSAVLLANHGPVVAGASLDAAAGAIEELEETARIFLLLQGHRTRWLTHDQVRSLRERFPG